MLKITYKKFGIIPTVEYYYGYDNVKPGFFDIVTISQSPQKISNKSFKEIRFHTGITNLKDDLNGTFQNFSRTTKYKINRAKREGIKYEVYNNPNESILKKYYMFYNAFLKSKKHPTITFSNIKKYQKNIILTLAKKNGEILCCHSYIKDIHLKKVRLLHSCSLFRLIKNDPLELNNEKKLIGFANNGLHFFDMNYFKDNGFIEYDWGGLYLGETDKQKINIDKFKLSFSPDIIEHYNYEKMPFILELLYKTKLYLGKIFG